MGILSGNPQEEPLHYGEVFGTWNYLLTAKATVAGYQMQLNHAGDNDLKKLLKDSIEGGQEEIKQVEKLLRKMGSDFLPLHLSLHMRAWMISRLVQGCRIHPLQRQCRLTLLQA
ncbi:uncharacterized protein DUF3231 [Bacillus sp. V-88]|nr:uncharacterized protein DUF3231 [Bacillus sp. V-88]SLK16461.1 Protein of unknown function [Bacillus sp. V-88]